MINRSRRTVGIATLGLLAAGALVALSGIGWANPADKVSGGSNLKAGAVGDGVEANRGAVLDSSQVCFINDRYMGKPQIPVKVQGKTYYGCCAGCAKTLQTDRTSRFSRDPLTGREVDKATATIAEDPRDSGKVLYFESEQTYERYLAGNR